MKKLSVFMPAFVLLLLSVLNVSAQDKDRQIGIYLGGELTSRIPI